MWYDNRQLCSVLQIMYIIIVGGIMALIAEQVWKIIMERLGGKK